MGGVEGEQDSCCCSSSASNASTTTTSTSNSISNIETIPNTITACNGQTTTKTDNNDIVVEVAELLEYKCRITNNGVGVGGSGGSDNDDDIDDDDQNKRDDDGNNNNITSQQEQNGGLVGVGIGGIGGGGGGGTNNNVKKGINANVNANAKFDYRLVSEHFLQAIYHCNGIDLYRYLQGFSELNKLIAMFGMIFSFVTHDIRSKIDFLHTKANDERTGTHYHTVEGMIRFELQSTDVGNSVGSGGGKGGAGGTTHLNALGCQNLLTLNRALEFIAEFLLELTKLSSAGGSGSLAARTAYDRTLAKYHPWLVRKSVQLALRGLPTRASLIERIYDGQPTVPDSMEESNQMLLVMADDARKVYTAVHKLFTDHGLIEKTTTTTTNSTSSIKGTKSATAKAK